MNKIVSPSQPSGVFSKRICIVMWRRAKFDSICFAVGISVLFIIAGYLNNKNHKPSALSRKSFTDKNFLRVNVRRIFRTVYFTTTPFPKYTSNNIEKLFDKTRSRIKYDLSIYNFSHSGVHKLEDLLLESDGKPIRSVIISTWRSGTTFLGQVLDAMPGNFYHHEPLMKFDVMQIRGLPDSTEALNNIKNMLRCNFVGMDSYFKYSEKISYQYSFNSRLWELCKYKKVLCYDAKFTGRFCKLFPFQSMKVVRIRLRLMQEILEDEELNVKIVFLIRDPRGVMQSRRHTEFCKPSPDCWRPELLCADMISDYVAAGRLLKQYPDKITVLRYEELAFQPYHITQNLFQFLRLGMTASVERFLSAHTNVFVAGVSSTFRISQNVPFKWKKLLDFKYVDEIQTVCKDAMHVWGYRLAHNCSHMASKEFIPVTEYNFIQ